MLKTTPIILQTLTNNIDVAVQHRAASASSPFMHAGDRSPLVEERFIALTLVKGAHPIIASNGIQVALNRNNPSACTYCQITSECGKRQLYKQYAPIVRSCQIVAKGNCTIRQHAPIVRSCQIVAKGNCTIRQHAPIVRSCQIVAKGNCTICQHAPIVRSWQSVAKGNCKVRQHAPIVRSRQIVIKGSCIYKDQIEIYKDQIEIWHRR